MRQQVFEFLKPSAQKLPISLEEAIRRELVSRKRLDTQSRAPFLMLRRICFELFVHTK